MNQRWIATPGFESGGRGWRRVTLVVGTLSAVTLGAAVCHCFAGAVPEESSQQSRPLRRSGPPLESAVDHRVADVAAQPDGTLRGRLTGGALGAPARVWLFQGPNAVAVVQADRNGRFVLPSGAVVGGVARLVAVGGGLSGSRYCRVWRAGAAPPHATGDPAIFLDRPVVRGQLPSGFPLNNVWDAAAWTGILGGAIAAPIIYDRAQDDNRVPQSP